MGLASKVVCTLTCDKCGALFPFHEDKAELFLRKLREVARDTHGDLDMSVMLVCAAHAEGWRDSAGVTAAHWMCGPCVIDDRTAPTLPQRNEAPRG